MNFVSIDFETANEKRNSACALGIVVVRENKIVDKKYWLIKPHELRFKPINVWIHGIVEEDVENEEGMDKLWVKIKPYFQNNFVIAHNASFDISVLRKTLDVYGISYPSFKYACTMLISKNYYDDAENYKLNTIAKYLNIEFKHHNALEDAEAAAKVLIKICEELDVNSIGDLENKLNIKAGKVYEAYYEPCKLSGMCKYRKSVLNDFSKVSLNKYENLNGHEGFFNKVVAFTGGLSRFSRGEAIKRITSMGAIAASSVTKKTDYLVVGVKSMEKLSFDRKSTKLRRAETLIKSGQDIKIISEEEFMNMI